MLSIIYLNEKFLYVKIFVSRISEMALTIQMKFGIWRAENTETGLRFLPSRPVVSPVSATEIAPGDLFPLFIAPRAATFFYKYRTVKAHAISLFCRLVEVYASFASMSTSPLSLLRCSSEGDIFSPARSLKGNFSCRY